MWIVSPLKNLLWVASDNPSDRSPALGHWLTLPGKPDRYFSVTIRERAALCSQLEGREDAFGFWHPRCPGKLRAS